MTVKWRKRTVVQFTPVSLFISVVVVALAIAFAAALTYYLTRRAYDTSHKHSDHPGTKDDSPSAEELLLPTDVKPLAYNLSIKTYLPFYVDFPPEKNLTFDGQVEISMLTLGSIKSIVLNAKNITVVPEKCEVTVNQEKVGIKSMMEHGRLEKVEFVLDSNIPKDKEVVLKVIYSGIISNTLGGLYQATYVHTDGTTKIAAVSQMEPTDARRMVPCFDEPKFKANWTVTVIHPKGTRVASNGIEKNGEGEVSGDWIISKFETTPRMSSYLLAVLISEFEYIEGFTKRGVRFRIWSRPEAKAMTAYALQAGIKCLEFYEQYFDIKFPLPKQDMVALPDFSAGAMENWGLITYRENALLYDDRYYAPSNKQRVALVVAHELAHQWFGNLVTLKWWDDLWLNEGFATFVEYLGTDEISDKHMRMMDYFLASSLDSGMHGDEVASSHPLSFRIDKASEVFEAFDGVTYDKGASVLTMISSLIGEEMFKQSVTHYLKRFSYNNAQASDLWTAFDETVKDVPGPRGSPLKIAEFADQWTSQMGFPMVTAESVNATTLRISQRRYKTSEQSREPEKYRHPKYGFKWDVPLWYQEGNDTEVKLAWLTRDEPLYLHTKTPDSSIVMNANRHGFYRQNYDANGWKKIIDRLHQNHEEYSARTRNAIISDAFAAAMISQLDYETVFRLLEYAKKEKEFLPWDEIIRGFSSVLKFFGNEPESKMAKNYMMSIMKPIYENSDIDFLATNYKSETLFFELILQQSVISTFCSFGSRDCLAKLKTLFDKEVMQKCKEGEPASQCANVAAPLRSMVYCYGVKEGGDAAFDKVMGMYKVEGVQLEKDHLLQALGCHQNITALKELLLLTLDRNSSFVRFQDVHKVFDAVSANPVGEEFMFNFLIERWEEILESLPTEYRVVQWIISVCAAGIRSEQQIEQMRNLQKYGLRASDFGAFHEEIEKAQHKVEWIKKHFRKLADFFKQYTSL